MEILQAWLNGQGNNAATALGKVLEGMGVDPAQVVAAVQAEQKQMRLDAVATAALEAGLTDKELAAAVQAKKAAQAKAAAEEVQKAEVVK